MKNATYNKLLVLVIACTLNSCATDPNSVHPSQLPIEPTPLPRLPAPQLPPPQPDSSSSYDNNEEGLSGGNYANSPGVLDFVDKMVSKHNFDRDYLINLFAQAKRLDSVIRLETGADHQPGPPKPHLGSWTRYREKFLNEERISNGVDFWHQHADAIQKASTTYGVDPEYIVGIIGVETYFGRNIGKTKIFDALTTLSFDTKRRASYFKSELENFLLMTREESMDPRKPIGSWAGAMGLGQFMPSSFRRLAVDFDHNGKRDLWHPHDAIGSVAHYFSKSGWQYREPVTTPAVSANAPNVIDLSTYEGDEYWATFHNFKVIKRYNNSKKYAMAVHQLAQAIKQRL